MVFPYLKGLIVIKEIFHIVLVYLLWCFCIQSLVLNKVADILTNDLGRGKFVPFKDKMRVVRNNFLSKREC
jgi:hypothetical protein